ncbi:MAG: 5-histidylcysteine sulfoxide synthase [Bacteriovorax sp.]|nr:5-histidylcysteine sulfoxide synthase [Bacteriovorax sp.]
MSVSITRNPNLTKTRGEKNFQSELQIHFGKNWWTGLSPENCPGFDKERQCLDALPLLNLDICSREDVLDYFNNSWTLTELLFQGLKTETVYMRPPYHGLRHPLIFYYGHPAVLYLNKLRLAGFYPKPINLYLEKVLETGVDEMSWDDMSKNEMEWPNVEAVHEYRKIVYALVSETIKTHPDLEFLDREKGNKPLLNSPWWALWMGMEHEKIHFETSSVLIRELPIEYVETPRYWAPIHPSKLNNETHENSWLKQNGGTVIIGKPKSAPSFGWDNEYGERIVNIRDFQYTKFQITNREYFDFVASGAYVNDSFWREEGIFWRKYRNTKRPTFWCGTGPEGSHEYELRTIFEIIPMPWNWPAEVNFHEAAAFANWKNEQDKKTLKTKLHYRLFTEAEFDSLRNGDTDPVLQKKHFRDDHKINDFKANFNFKWSSCENVTEELCGNAWHWVEDQFNPLTNFEIHSLYDDFSTPCFDGKHHMILGGSFISTGHEASRFARFHFRPHFNQHSGFRLAASLDGSFDNGAVKLVKSDEYIHPRRENVLDQMMVKKDWWKKIDQPLEMNEEEIKTLFTQTQVEVLGYMKNFENMSPMGLAHDPNTNGLKKDFILPYQMTKNFPERPENYNSLLKLIFNEMAPLSQLPGHPGFAAYVAGSGNVISNTAQLIAQTLNPFSGHYMMAPGLVALEQEVIKWFISLMGYSEKSALGYLTTGGSSATMNALIMARLNKLKGFDYSKVTGYISNEAHHCVAKAWVMLGFKKENLRLIKAQNFKMNIKELEKVIAADTQLGLTPFFLVGTVGTTKTGSVDNINALADIAEKENLWLHADGAYGALFMLTQKGRELLKGIERADSIALDPHKALSIPYGTGCLLVKDSNNMSFDYISDDSYMPPKPTIGDHDYADISPELSRDYRGLRVWLPIKTLGIAPFILNLEEKLNLSTWLCEELKTINELVIISSPELTILAFAHKNGDESTRELMRKINTKGTLFLSSCMLEGKLAIRVCLLGYRLHFNRLETAVNEIREMASQC